MIDTSLHAKKRIKERMGTTSDRIAHLALERGIDRKETTGSIRRYLDNIYFNSGEYQLIKVYNNTVFVYDVKSDRYVLITAMHLPSKYQKTIQRIKEKKYE